VDFPAKAVVFSGVTSPEGLTGEFHYTDGAGLLGILQGGRIWLSNAAGLNDPSEIYHGLQFGAAALKARAAGESRAAGFFATEFER
jgi:hypothetical protein